MAENQQGRTTKAVLDMMKADAARRGVPLNSATAVAAPVPTEVMEFTSPPQIAVRPFGPVDELLTLSKVRERASLLKPTLLEFEEREAMKVRIAAAPAKIAAAKAAGWEPAKIKQAELTLAELQDKLALDTMSAARWYLLDVAYRIARDFRVNAKNDLASALSEAGGDITLNVPGLLTIRVDLAGPDDEPPF